MRKAFLATSFVCALGGAEIPVIGNTKAMEESFRRIAIKKAKEGKIDENTRTLVENLLANIQETLEPDLQSDISVQQAMYDSAFMAVGACGAVLDKDMTGVRSTLGGWKEARHESLRDCKVSEGIRFDTEETKCGALEADVLNLHVCNPENPPEWSEDSWEVYQWMQCLKDHVHPVYGSFNDQRQGCAIAESDHGVWEQWCRDQQVSFEESYCMLEGAVHHNCHEYDTCRADSEHAFQMMTEATQNLEARVHTQQVGLNNLICLGREILADTVNVDNCNEETTHCAQCDNGGTLTISYKNLGAKVDCMANEAHPHMACDEAWHQEFYAEIESASAPMNPCTAVCSDGVEAFDASYYIHQSWNAPAAAPAAGTEEAEAHAPAPACNSPLLFLLEPTTASVLRVSEWATQATIDSQGDEDQRNNVINFCNAHSNHDFDSMGVQYFQGKTTEDLISIAGAMIVLHRCGFRNLDQLLDMTDEDQRNTLITELTNLSDGTTDLQALSTWELVVMAEAYDQCLALPGPV